MDGRPKWKVHEKMLNQGLFISMYDRIQYKKKLKKKKIKKNKKKKKKKREIQIKTTRYHFSPVRMAIIKSL